MHHAGVPYGKNGKTCTKGSQLPVSYGKSRKIRTKRAILKGCGDLEQPQAAMAASAARPTPCLRSRGKAKGRGVL